MTDTLDNLRRRIVSLYNQRTDSNELGTVALEILLKRNEARNELENNPTFDKKNEVERRIDELHELERIIVTLYMLQGTKSISGKSFTVSDYAKSKYRLFNTKTMP
jgi:hypothetical protein